MKKIILFTIITLIVIVVLYFGKSVVHMANIGCAYKAKILGSAVFVSNRIPETVLNEDLSDPTFKFIKANMVPPHLGWVKNLSDRTHEFVNFRKIEICRNQICHSTKIIDVTEASCS